VTKITNKPVLLQWKAHVNFTSNFAQFWHCCWFVESCSPHSMFPTCAENLVVLVVEPNSVVLVFCDRDVN
jgi:hypothetical protein